MGVKTESAIADASRTELGEVDTSAPFESVKAAVSMFGENAFSPSKLIIKKSKPYSAENALARETHHHVAQKELKKLKEQLENCETTRTQALAELHEAKQTVEDLTKKLKIINESSESAVRLTATETAVVDNKQFQEVGSRSHIEAGDARKGELDNAREHYAVAITELGAAKQDLRRIRQDFVSSTNAKMIALQQENEAKRMATINTDRANQLSKKISVVQESTIHVKSAFVQVKQKEAALLSAKDTSRKFHKLALGEAESRLLSLRKEYDPGSAVALEAKLAETTAEIASLQKETEKARVSDINSVKTVATELDDAKGVLQKVAEEEISLRSLLDSLKLELESVKREHSELKEKEAQTESTASNLNAMLQKSKAELEKATAGEEKARMACNDLMSTLQQLSLESDDAKKDAEVKKKNAAQLRKESETTRISLAEADKRLDIALKNAEAAKAAETDALNKIKILSDKANVARSSTSESGAKITISVEEYESLSRKVKESETLAEMRVAAAMAQVEAVKASENEATQKLEASSKEIDEIKLAIENALKGAEMAENARKALEAEIRRWHEKEQKKASRILDETELSKSNEISPPTAQKGEGQLKTTEKTPTMKKSILPNFSGIFNRRKTNLGSSASLSYLPGLGPVMQDKHS